MGKMVIRKTFARAFILVLLLVGSGLYGQSIGARPGVAFYSDTVGFEGLLEGRFDVPLFEDGPGQITGSAFIGYSYNRLEEASKGGLMLGVGGGYEIGLGLDGLYTTPGLITGVEFSQFEEATLESGIAIMLIPYVETGYEFDFNLSVGLQTGLKNLIYTGENGASERSMTVGLVVHYTLGD